MRSFWDLPWEILFFRDGDQLCLDSVTGKNKMPRPWIEPGSSDLQSDALPSELPRLLLLQMQAGSSSSRHGEQLLKAAFADGCGVGVLLATGAAPL